MKHVFLSAILFLLVAAATCEKRPNLLATPDSAAQGSDDDAIDNSSAIEPMPEEYDLEDVEPLSDQEEVIGDEPSNEELFDEDGD